MNNQQCYTAKVGAAFCVILATAFVITTLNLNSPTQSSFLRMEEVNVDIESNSPNALRSTSVPSSRGSSPERAPSKSGSSPASLLRQFYNQSASPSTTGTKTVAPSVQTTNSSFSPSTLVSMTNFVLVHSPVNATTSAAKDRPFLFLFPR